MLNINKLMVLGHLTREPELNTTTNGTDYINLGIAINRKYKQNQENKTEVCFLDVTMFGKLAGVISEYFKKGDAIYLEGRLKFDQWEKDGVKKNKLSMIADSFEFANFKTKELEGFYCY